MRVGLVHITSKQPDLRAELEETVEVELLRIGRGTGNALIVPGLSVRLEHCVIERIGDRFQVRPLDDAAIRVNQTYVNRARRVRPGDVLRIGKYDILIQQPDPGFDLAIQVEQTGANDAEADGLARRTRLGINRGWLARPFIAALAATAAALLFIGVPLFPDATLEPTAELQSVASALKQSWSSGPISPGHAHFGDRCETCHTAGFERVANDACTECHADVAAHAPPAFAEDERFASCVDCHAEHRGDSLARLSDSLCVDCHANLEARFPGTELLDARDFAVDHPEFRPSVFTGPGPNDRSVVSLAEDPRESSGLSFGHREHLDPQLRGPDGAVQLACADCHQPDDAGALMRPIDFEEDCRACHTLGFDTEFPDQQAPHTGPRRVRDFVTAFYAARALRDGVPDAPPPERRRAGGTKPREPARSDPAAWAARRAGVANEHLLGAAGECRLCHEFLEDAPGVRPVRVLPLARPKKAGLRGANNRWLPRARFTHDAHRHGHDCEDCHAVRDSGSSADIGLPGVDVCRECHGNGAPVAGRVASDCLRCHGFHYEPHGLMTGGGV